MKFSKVGIGVVNGNNLNKINNLETSNGICNILFSDLNLLSLNKDDINNIISSNICIIPSKHNIKDLNKIKRKKEYTLFVDWILNQNQSIKILMSNDSLLYIAEKDVAWHDSYDGSLGYAVSKHTDGEDTIFYGYSASIKGNPEKLILKEFDGFFLKNL